MTADEYRSVTRGWGLVPVPGARNGNDIMHSTRDGMFTYVPDPDTLSDDERVTVIDILRIRLGITNH